MNDSLEPVRFDTKVSIVLRDDLLPWQQLNVTAFLMSGIATSEPDLVGEPYRDADATEYLPMLRQPVLVLSASAEVLAEARSRALGRGMTNRPVALSLFLLPSLQGRGRGWVRGPQGRAASQAGEARFARTHPLPLPCREGSR